MSTDDRVAVTPGIARPHASPGLAGPDRLGLVTDRTGALPDLRPAAPRLVGDSDSDVYDVCVGVSHSGTTPETVRALGPAHRPRRAITAALTDAAPCPVADADAADAALGTVVRETGLRQGAISVRIAQLAIVDRVLIAVTRRTPHQAEAAPRATFDTVHDLRLEGQPRR
ncbi:hypothetical protein AQJ43_36205 [Streptomyces avermitilis]|nr:MULTISPECIES: SIS domain-containing protein [Streptomyces]KUN49145.1 hypothetical protein AQJ43_36205 [Streptomyces avermitilis]OOV24354.1 hypothetical protein SM007_31685 [Streptomyces avermitilis]BBJ50142.1 hypothetical protein SAVMC3_27710 [Streptomyces avermitilis]GDY62159.1 hypothetical protein SAV14893_015520 [Streptomyces avermitilis]GDY77737.1 hypothetical protein SAV31267_072220 [Streptomyces avermitilis]